MKKMISLFLTALLVCSSTMPVFASHETLVSYEGDGTSSYLLIVPATLSPGDSGEVKLEGTWPSNETIVVTADDTVTLTNDIDSSIKILDIEFSGISQPGDNTNEISITEDISVADIENALFGTWSGKFYYNLSVEDDVVTDDTEDPYGFSHLLLASNSEETTSTTLLDKGYVMPGDKAAFSAVAYYNNGELIEMNSANTEWSLEAVEGELEADTTIEDGVVTISDSQADLTVMKVTVSYTDKDNNVYEKSEYLLVSDEDIILTAEIEDADEYYTGEEYTVTATAQSVSGQSVPMQWALDINPTNGDYENYYAYVNENGTVTADDAGEYTITAWSEYMFAQKAEDSVTFVDNTNTDVTEYAATFADNSWSDIISAVQNDAVPTTWAVGDTKSITINSIEYDIQIIGKDHDTYSDGSGTAPLTFQLVECYGTKARMNSTSNNTIGWSGSAMRTTTMSEILSAMPSEVQSAIKAVDKETLKGDKSGLETTSDKLFLLSEVEVFNTTNNSNGNFEGSQYAFYANGGSAVKNFEGSVAGWLLRGPRYDSSTGFSGVDIGGTLTSIVAHGPTGVSFAFCF